MSESKEVVQTEPKSTALVEYSEDQMEVIKKYIAPNCPDVELKFLVEKSKECGMSVIKNECYFVPAQSWDNYKKQWSTKWSVQTSIDFYRKRGMGTGNIEYIECKPMYIVSKPGEGKIANEWRNIEGMAYPPVPEMAICRIKLKDMSKPIEHTVYWKEYARTNKKGEYMAMWSKMPGIMLCKVAEAGCWRKAVPELAGIYTSDEMIQAGYEHKEQPEPEVENENPDIEPHEVEVEKVEEVIEEPTVELPELPDETLVSSILEELTTCDTPPKVNKWFELRSDQINSLPDKDRDMVNKAFQKRMDELQKEIKGKDKDEPEIPMVTDTFLRTIYVIMRGVVDENGSPYMEDQEQIEAFTKAVFKVDDVTKIKMSGATKFYAKFNAKENASELLDLYCNFRNQAL